MEHDGEAVEGDGKNFCQAPLSSVATFLFPDEVGVVRMSASRTLAGALVTRGDISDGDLQTFKFKFPRLFQMKGSK